jgi:hypothetical protein
MLLHQPLEQLILAAAVVAHGMALLERQAALASLSFDIQIHSLRQHLQLVHQQSQWQAGIAFTNGLAQGVSHSDGTLCTNF